ncbi:MAG: hypothetical protein SHS37scaffold145_76 [Phage 71_18]|nr:MAG: hypothetical protein SHS37scaffold145_76 [Phage 71_18]
MVTHRPHTVARQDQALAVLRDAPHPMTSTELSAWLTRPCGCLQLGTDRDPKPGCSACAGTGLRHWLSTEVVQLMVPMERAGMVTGQRYDWMGGRIGWAYAAAPVELNAEL